MLDGIVDVTKNQSGVEKAQSNVKLICSRKDNWPSLGEFNTFISPVSGIGPVGPVCRIDPFVGLAQFVSLTNM